MWLLSAHVILFGFWANKLKILDLFFSFASFRLDLFFLLL